MKNSKDLKELMRGNFSKEEIFKMEMEAQISGAITKLRLEAGLTQEQLAKKAGINQSAIARIENDDSIPRMDTFIKICNALDHKIEIVERDFEKGQLVSSKDIVDIVNDAKQLMEKLEKRQESFEGSFKVLCNKFDKLMDDQKIVQDWFAPKQFKFVYDSQKSIEIATTRASRVRNLWKNPQFANGGN